MRQGSCPNESSQPGLPPRPLANQLGCRRGNARLDRAALRTAPVVSLRKPGAGSPRWRESGSAPEGHTVGHALGALAYPLHLYFSGVLGGGTWQVYLAGVLGRSGVLTESGPSERQGCPNPRQTTPIIGGQHGPGADDGQSSVGIGAIDE